MKNCPFIAKNNFLIGFEVEAVFRKMSFDGLTKLVRKIHPKIRATGDGSIEPDHDESEDEPNNYCTAEVVTPPLPSKTAMQVLEKVFKIVKSTGYTNESTGLHVNFSPISNEFYYRINPFYIWNHKLFRQIAEDFGREHNDYCFCYPNLLHKGASRTRSMGFNLWHNKEMRDMADEYDDKGIAVNLSNFSEQRTKTSRIEVRVMGNKGYHLNFDKVAKHTNSILKVITESTRS